MAGLPFARSRELLPLTMGCFFRETRTQVLQACSDARSRQHIPSAQRLSILSSAFVSSRLEITCLAVRAAPHAIPAVGSRSPPELQLLPVLNRLQRDDTGTLCTKDSPTLYFFAPFTPGFVQNLGVIFRTGRACSLVFIPTTRGVFWVIR